MNETQPSSNRLEVVSPGHALEASYFAAALAKELAITAKSEHPEVVLIDGLPGCGGVDVALDRETQDGVRWPSLRGAQGYIDAEMLLDSLLLREGVGILSHMQNAHSACTPEVTERVTAALSGRVTWCVETRSDEAIPAANNVLVIAHGSICALAAVQAYLKRCPEQISVGLVLVETPVANRAMVEESLGVPVVAHAPTRWHMSAVAERNILDGRWPHAGDRAFGSLVKDSAIYVRSFGRCLAWA